MDNTIVNVFPVVFTFLTANVLINMTVEEEIIVDFIPSKWLV